MRVNNQKEIESALLFHTGVFQLLCISTTSSRIYLNPIDLIIKFSLTREQTSWSTRWWASTEIRSGGRWQLIAKYSPKTLRNTKSRFSKPIKIHTTWTIHTTLTLPLGCQLIHSWMTRRMFLKNDLHLQETARTQTMTWLSRKIRASTDKQIHSTRKPLIRTVLMVKVHQDRQLIITEL